MATTTHPVDSTTRPCCGGIGAHTRDCTTTWRDLADQLTAEQIEVLEEQERLEAAAFVLLWLAERKVERNHLARQYADVPAPADATSVDHDDWENWNDGPTRHFRGTHRRDRRVHVGINGFQRTDGTVAERWVFAEIVGDDSLTADEARELGTYLLAAADELDALNGCDACPVLDVGRDGPCDFCVVDEGARS